MIYSRRIYPVIPNIYGDELTLLEVVGKLSYEIENLKRVVKHYITVTFTVGDNSGKILIEHYNNNTDNVTVNDVIELLKAGRCQLTNGSYVNVSGSKHYVGSAYYDSTTNNIMLVDNTNPGMTYNVNASNVNLFIVSDNIL